MIHQYAASNTATFPAPPPSSPGEPPLALRIFSILLQIFSIVLLTYCISTRWPSWQTIRSQPFISWINILLYIDSLLFTTAQMITRYAFGLQLNFQACQSAVMFCLSFYLSTKLLIYFYFTERSFLVWSNRGDKRSRNFFYVFNMTAIIGGYLTVIVLTYIFRINNFSISGECVIGIQRKAGIALATYETAINIYLTFLFLFPLRKVYGYKAKKNVRLRNMAIRCMTGTSITTLSTGANLATVVALGGEHAWLCLMLCNLDVIVCVIVLHWITSFGKDNLAETKPSRTSELFDFPSKRRPTGNSDLLDSMQQRTMSDPMVTTSITYEQDATTPQSTRPNVISVSRQQSQTIDSIEPKSVDSTRLPSPCTSKFPSILIDSIEPTSVDSKRLSSPRTARSLSVTFDDSSPMAGMMKTHKPIMLPPGAKFGDAL